MLIDCRVVIPHTMVGFRKLNNNCCKKRREVNVGEAKGESVGCVDDAFTNDDDEINQCVAMQTRPGFMATVTD